MTGLRIVAPDDPAPETDGCLAILKGVIAEIESGRQCNSVYVLADFADPDDRARVIRVNRSTDMTVAEAVFRLELEKAMVLQMMLET